MPTKKAVSVLPAEAFNISTNEALIKPN